MNAKILIVPIALAAALPALAQQGAGQQGGVRLTATLSGANEVTNQGVRNQGDPDGTGSFTGRLIPGQGRLCYTLTWANIATPGAAHIHTGAAGVNGGIFVGLSDLTAGEHCITVTREQATAIVAKPQNFYVNIHTGDFPNGAVRGQLSKNG